MPRYGKNLKSVLEDHEYELSDASIYNLGIRLLDILEVVHGAGLVFNDLCLENILLGHREVLPTCDMTDSMDDCFKDVHISLVNFNNATKWRSIKTGKHFSQVEVADFKGNLAMASVNQLMEMRTSRRDDLHSLAYLLIFLLNNGNLPVLQSLVDSSTESAETRLAQVLNFKQTLNLTDWCIYRVSPLKSFCREI